MANLPYFRTFVNAFGTSPSNLLWPIQRIQPLQVSRSLVEACYWRLCGLTLDYSYVINDFPIHRKLHIDGTRFGLKERIQGGWLFANPGPEEEGMQVDDTLGLTAWFKLYLCQIYDPTYAGDSKARSDQYKALLQAQPLLCTDPPLPETHPLGLLLYFKEMANNGDFILTTMREEGLSTPLHTFTLLFLGKPLNLSLSTACPQDIEGHITAATLTPEFFMVETPPG